MTLARCSCGGARLPHATGILFPLAAVVLAGCMPDAALRSREEASGGLAGEVRLLERDLARLRARERELERRTAALPPRGTLAGALGALGLRVERGDLPGTLKVSLRRAFEPGGRALSEEGRMRLLLAGKVLRERLPGSELCVRTASLVQAVSAVRTLSEAAGLRGERLRAESRPGLRPGELALAVHPTGAKEFRDVMAALDE